MYKTRMLRTPAHYLVKGLSATDISNAQPSESLSSNWHGEGGDREYLIRLNSNQQLISALNNVAIKTVNGAPFESVNCSISRCSSVNR